MLFLPTITPQVEDGTLSISLNDSLHSETSSSMILIVNDADVTLADMLTAAECLS